MLSGTVKTHHKTQNMHCPSHNTYKHNLEAQGISKCVWNFHCQSLIILCTVQDHKSVIHFKIVHSQCYIYFNVEEWEVSELSWTKDQQVHIKHSGPRSLTELRCCGYLFVDSKYFLNEHKLLQVTDMSDQRHSDPEVERTLESLTFTHDFNMEVSFPHFCNTWHLKPQSQLPVRLLRSCDVCVFRRRQISPQPNARRKCLVTSARACFAISWTKCHLHVGNTM